MDEEYFMGLARRVHGGHPMAEVIGKQAWINHSKNTIVAQKVQVVAAAKAPYLLKAEQIQKAKDAVKNGNA